MLGKNDPGFVHNGPLAGLVAVCAGSDVMHPMGALVVGGIAGALFVVMFTLTQKTAGRSTTSWVSGPCMDCGAWGGIAAGIFGQKAVGGLGGVAFMPQLLMTGMAIIVAMTGSFIVYGLASNQRSVCVWIASRNMTAPISPSTRSRQHRSASRIGDDG